MAARKGRPRLLDLFSGAGGAAVGYHRAGFDVVGVDLHPQPRYPFEFWQMDALELMSSGFERGLFDAIHASPPCQAYTNAQKLRKNDHPDLVGPVRELLQATGLPYVIENVPKAPLLDPVELCGAMFGLKTYRHRLFETNWPLVAPEHPPHTCPVAKMGRPPAEGQYMHVVGNFSCAPCGRAAMGIDWMTRDELREAVPPAYTEDIGRQLLEQL